MNSLVFKMIIFLVVATTSLGDTNKTYIYWPNTEEYKEIILSLKYSADSARALLVNTMHGVKKVYFDSYPAFVYDGCYVFHIPRKTGEVSVEGYYVNGNTGIIQYRKSNVYIEKFTQTMPSNPYTEITVESNHPVSALKK